MQGISEITIILIFILVIFITFSLLFSKRSSATGTKINIVFAGVFLLTFIILKASIHTEFIKLLFSFGFNYAFLVFVLAATIFSPLLFPAIKLSGMLKHSKRSVISVIKPSVSLITVKDSKAETKQDEEVTGDSTYIPDKAVFGIVTDSDNKPKKAVEEKTETQEEPALKETPPENITIKEPEVIIEEIQVIENAEIPKKKENEIEAVKEDLNKDKTASETAKKPAAKKKRQTTTGVKKTPVKPRQRKTPGKKK